MTDQPGGASPAYDDREPEWQRRRRRRQAATLVVFVLLVVAAGAYATALFLGKVSLPSGKDDPATTTAAPCRKVAVKAQVRLDPRRIKVNVYNATSRSGLASKTATALRSRRFLIAKVGNDPKGQRVSGTAVIRYGKSGRAAATSLAAHVPGVRTSGDKRTTAVVDLVLGSRFTTLGPPPKAAKPATRCAPATKTPGATRPTTTPR